MAGVEGERWVGLATDFSEGSRAALRWAAANLLRAGDHLLLLHVIKEPDYEQSEAILWESTGSRTHPFSNLHHLLLLLVPFAWCLQLQFLGVGASATAT